MNEQELKQLQEKHRRELAEARERVKQRKARTRRLIQVGANLESTLPQTVNMSLDEIKAYLHGLAK